MGMIGKPSKKLVHVDFAGKLAELGLAKFFPHEVLYYQLVHARWGRRLWICMCQAWPSMLAVRELATQLKKREKQGEEGILIFADLKKSVLDTTVSRML